MKLKKFDQFINENSGMSPALKKTLAELQIPTTKEEAIDYIEPMLELYRLGLSDERFDLIDLEVVYVDRRFGLEPEDWNRFLANIKKYGALHQSSFAVSSFTSKVTAPSTQLWAELFTMPLAAFFAFKQDVLDLIGDNEDNFEGPKMIGSPTKRDVTWNDWIRRIQSTKN